MKKLLCSLIVFCALFFFILQTVPQVMAQITAHKDVKTESYKLLMLFDDMLNESASFILPDIDLSEMRKLPFIKFPYNKRVECYFFNSRSSKKIYCVLNDKKSKEHLMFVVRDKATETIEFWGYKNGLPFKMKTEDGMKLWDKLISKDGGVR